VRDRRATRHGGIDEPFVEREASTAASVDPVERDRLERAARRLVATHLLPCEEVGMRPIGREIEEVTARALVELDRLSPANFVDEHEISPMLLPKDVLGPYGDAVGLVRRPIVDKRLEIGRRPNGARRSSCATHRCARSASS
jgi:hypothetical protein